MRRRRWPAPHGEFPSEWSYRVRQNAGSGARRGHGRGHRDPDRLLRLRHHALLATDDGAALHRTHARRFRAHREGARDAGNSLRAARRRYDGVRAEDAGDAAAHAACRNRATARRLRRLRDFRQVRRDRMGRWPRHARARRDRSAHQRSGGALSRQQHEIFEPSRSEECKMSDQPTTNKQTDKTPPLPDLERDVDMVARAESAPPTAPEDSMSPKMASDLEAVLDVPVHVSAVLGRTRMDIGDLLKLGSGTVLELDRKVGESIDIFMNNRLVARGEVVLVEDRLGITMTEIIKSDRS